MKRLNRRNFLQKSSVGISAFSLSAFAYAVEGEQAKPNVILCMSDDQGWGDAGYNGHPVIQTPHLDRMASEGIRFNRFYSGAPVCSPTRGSCMTGRHPYRYGIFFANSGHMKKQEITLAEALKSHGYATGHFGKWHLGTLTKTMKDGRRGGRQNQHYSPPWENGFDVCFSTEQAVPTWNPMVNQPFETKYWIGDGQYAQENLEGDDSRIIMDRAIPFIQNSVKNQNPFLAVIWFHSPHSVVIAGDEYRAMYPHQDENKQHYYGCITAMDEQIGRLREELQTLGVAENTMIWYCSDNGPAGEGGGTKQIPGGRQQGSTGLFRGRKGSLYEGGVRVPGLMVWPGKIKETRTVKMPCSTSDYYPTILDLLNIQTPRQPRPIDGVSLKPLLEGKMTERPSPLGFQSGKQLSLTGNRYKIYSGDQGETYELYDLLEDPGEKNNLVQEHPDILRSMIRKLEKWRASCKTSLEEKDL